MSVSPKNLISRFHDLKIWQRHHDNIFKRSRKNSRESPVTDLSNLDVMDGVSILERSPLSTPEKSPVQNREEIVLPSPPKTFDQILQEKLKEDREPVGVMSKPKKPFLKKGSGLKRYRLEPGVGMKFINKTTGNRDNANGSRRMATKPKTIFRPASACIRECKLKAISNIKKTSPKLLKITNSDTRMASPTRNSKEIVPKSTVSSLTEGCSEKISSELGQTAVSSVRETKTNHKRNIADLKKSLDLTPLKMPCLNVQVKAKWCKADEMEAKKNVRFADAGDFYFNKASKDKITEEVVEETTETIEAVIEEVCEKNESIEKSRDDMLTQSNFTCKIDPRNDQLMKYSDQTLYEEQLKKELLLFEMLEEKAENSSFCSTNSSIIQLLANTPTKFKLGYSPRKMKPDTTSLRPITESDVRDARSSNVTKNFELEFFPNKMLSQTTPSKSIRDIDSNANDPPNSSSAKLKFDHHTDNIMSFTPISDAESLDVDLSNASSTNFLLEQIRALLESKMSSEIFEETPEYSESTQYTHKNAVEDSTKTSTVTTNFERNLSSSTEETTPSEDFLENIQNKDTKAIGKFSDEEVWSTNTELSDSSLNTSSEIDESQCLMENKAVKDATTNTVFEDESQREADGTDSCLTCADQINKKLIELNEEISRFRLDNNSLKDAGKQLQQERVLFEEHMRKLRKEFEDEKKEFLFNLEEDNKKLARDRMVFERYAKEVRKQPNRKEREEISNLKIEVANFKEIIKLKDAKNGSTQARLRTQLKSLEKENSNLKDEVEKLTRENAKLIAQQKLNPRPSDTKIIHEINKNLSRIAKEAFKSRSSHSDSLNKDDSDSDILERKKDRIKISKQQKVKPEVDNRPDKDEPQKLTKDGKILIDPVGRNPMRNSGRKSDNEGNKEDTFDDSSFKSLNEMDVERDYEKVFGHIMKSTKGKQENLSSSDTRRQERVETRLEDGSTEVKYDNGNLKIVSPDGKYITMKYQNGDIKETDLNEGITKYRFYYNQSCHITYSDGTEVLEFPNGQVEKKYSDGKCEVIFQNGIVRAVKPDNSEEISYPDGTFVRITANGEKTMFLNNGQKEIHTENEKKRVYPDGTVKILYNDGKQETRYSNGRIRIKDQDGNLLMDSHKI